MFQCLPKAKSPFKRDFSPWQICRMSGKKGFNLQRKVEEGRRILNVKRNKRGIYYSLKKFLFFFGSLLCTLSDVAWLWASYEVPTDPIFFRVCGLKKVFWGSKSSHLVVVVGHKMRADTQIWVYDVKNLFAWMATNSTHFEIKVKNVLFSSPRFVSFPTQEFPNILK